MAIETWVRDGTQFRKAKEVWVKDATDWRKAKEVWVRDATDWRLVFRAFTPGFSANGPYGSFSHDGAYNTGAAVVLKTDGSVSLRAGRRSLVSGGYWITQTDYDDGTWGLPLTAAIGSQYWCKAVIEAGGPIDSSGGSAASFVYSLSSPREWIVTDGASSSFSSSTVTLGLYIYSDSGGTSQVAYKSRTITVSNTNE